MPFYLRKAFKAGPVRINLSKGGIGLSAGVTGARLGANRRGVYVHGGRQGIYYRKHLKKGRANEGTRGGSDAANVRGGVAPRLQHVRPEKGHPSDWQSAPTSLHQQTDLFRDTGELFPCRFAELPEIRFPKVPPLPAGGGKPVVIASAIVLLVALTIWQPLLGLIAGVSSLALMIMKRQQHQELKTLAYAFADFYDNWLDEVRPDPDQAIAELQALEMHLSETFTAHFFHGWYMMLLEMTVQRTVMDSEPDEEAVLHWSALVQKLEPVLMSDPAMHTPMKQSVFRSLLEQSLEDHLISEDEERNMRQLITVLGLSEKNITPELNLLTAAAEVRNTLNAPFEPLSIQLPVLQKTEQAYIEYKPVRLLEERVLQRFQREGMRYRELGYRTQLEGKVIITNRRFIVTDGGRDGSMPITRDYRLDRISDVIADQGRNLIEIRLTDRKNPIYLSAPDSVPLAARLEHATNVFAG